VFLLDTDAYDAFGQAISKSCMTGTTQRCGYKWQIEQYHRMIKQV
jgi:hypothetical protein